MIGGSFTNKDLIIDSRKINGLILDGLTERQENCISSYYNKKIYIKYIADSLMHLQKFRKNCF